MNYDNLLRQLRAEREKLNQVIAALEELSTTGVMNAFRPKHRGRKSMGAQERLEVAERMRKYWAGRRKAKAARA